jgi:gamma-glutamylcyclotransferase
VITSAYKRFLVEGAQGQELNELSEMVFAYGSNMCSGRFRAYGLEPIGHGHAVLLDGYRLDFSKLSKDGSGKATVSPCSSHQVWGVLYEIHKADLACLDKGEGTGYTRSKVTVRNVDGNPVDAWIYIATKPITTRQLRPYTWYKRFLVEGAQEHLLPLDYVTQLQAIDSTIDSDRERHAEKWALICTSPAD